LSGTRLISPSWSQSSPTSILLHVRLRSAEDIPYTTRGPSGS